MPETPSKLRVVLTALGDFFTLQTLIKILLPLGGGALAALRVDRRLIPSTWDKQDKILAALGVFCLSALVITTLVTAATWAWPRAVRLFRRTFLKPNLVVTAVHPGREAVLMMHNRGSAATVWAEGQITAAEPGGFRHHAPYRMVWRDEASRLTRGRVQMPTGGTMKLILAEYSASTMPGVAVRMLIPGDASDVDVFWERNHRGFPTVTIQVELFADPRPKEGLIQQYRLTVHDDEYHVAVEPA